MHGGELPDEDEDEGLEVIVGPIVLREHGYRESSDGKNGPGLAAVGGYAQAVYREQGDNDDEDDHGVHVEAARDVVDGVAQVRRGGGAIIPENGPDGVAANLRGAAPGHERIGGVGAVEEEKWSETHAGHERGQAAETNERTPFATGE